MSLASWRQFPFFEGTPIKDPNYGSENDALYSDPSISAICSTNKYIAIATNQSVIKLIDSQFEKKYQFQCYDLGWTITKLAFFYGLKHNSNGFLVTIAERQGLPLSLKLWNLDKLLNPQYNMKKFDYNSTYHTICTVTNGQNNYPMTCFSYSKDYSIFAFGYSNGSVILVRGDILHDRGSKQRLIYENKEPITSINFKDNLTLYISTISKIFTLSTTGKNNGHLDKILDDKEGSDINCSDIYLENNNRLLLTGRDECFQFYNLKGKSHSIQLNIPKKRIFVYRNRYVLFLSYTNSNLTESSIISSNRLIIIDLKNKYIVYNQSISSSIFDIFEYCDDLYVFLSDGSLLKLHEKPLKENIQILKNNELFQIAIKLTNESSSEFSKTDIMNLKKSYGFYLYEKGEFSDSIEQFMQCIPLGKTSEIISKFKESSKIQYLVKYLEKMIELEVSTADHINLLLISYCKLKRKDDFILFINNIEVDEDFDILKKHKEFDMNIIIQLCKENEYFDLALLIAQKFNLSSIFVSIQLNDMNDAVSTIKYIESLTIDDLLRILIDNVSSLLNLLPNETTQLLIDVFTGKYTPKSRDLEIDNNTKENNKSTSYPLITSYKQFVLFMRSKEIEDDKVNQIGNDENSDNADEYGINKMQPTYQPPKPRIIFSSFINHNYEFVIFLEACIESYDTFSGNLQDKKDLMNTLYEMYLTLSSEDLNNKHEWESKAKKLLNERTEWSDEDKVSLLLISNMYDFNDGELIIRESTDNVESIECFELDIFRSAVFSGNLDRSFDIVIKYGEKDHELYKLALTTYTCNNDFLNTIGEDKLKKILVKIEELDILTPLEVLDCLTRGNANVKLGLVKDFLLRNIEKQKTVIHNNENLVNAYEDKLKDLKNQIDDLLHNPKLVNSTKCSVCSGQLDFPIIYFKCGHQIHESCLTEFSGISQIVSDNIGGPNDDDNNISCPICAVDQDALTMLKKQQQEVSLRQDLFQASLQKSNDRFKSMFNFLGRGGMESSKIIVNDEIIN